MGSFWKFAVMTVLTIGQGIKAAGYNKTL